MQHINLNKTIELESKISDLLLISIDDQIETTQDKEGVKIIGNIAVGGKAKTLEGEKTFDDKICLDIFLTEDEIMERNSLNISVNDFSYELDENKLILNISLKIEGLKEIETTFLAQEDNEPFQKEEIEEKETEIEIDKKVYIDVDVDINERNENNDTYIEKEEILEEDNIIIEEEDNNEEIKEETEVCERVIEEPKKKSLLKSVFSSKKINEEVSWKLHCVKNENSYEEIANKYNVNLNKLISINNNEKLSEGKLIFIPLE